MLLNALRVKFGCLPAIVFLMPVVSSADLKMAAVFGDGMVLQQGMADPVWGWDVPGTEVTVRFAGQTKSAVAGTDGRWVVKLGPLAASGVGAVLAVRGTAERAFQDVLVGEVWVCSGQSNMEWPVSASWDGDLEAMGAKFPQIRLMTVPLKGTQVPQDDFKGEWLKCAPETVGGFSAVGFYYGRRLHEILGVPVGLIDNAWGGSAAEAWVRREVLEGDERFKPLMERTVQNEARLQDPAAQAKYEAELAAWNALPEGERAGKRGPNAPSAWLNGNARPGNIYNGSLRPTIGYGIKGVIWYQGESNAGRAAEYADLFPTMISNWRKDWGQGDFPFYWVQLADFMEERKEPGESGWAELRESQTRTQAAVPNGGQAVIVDLGEAADIHPRNKRDVAERLARWALAKDYGKPMVCRSPELKAAVFADGKARVTLDLFGSEKLRTLDVKELRGFAICGEDKKWVWAEAQFAANDTLEVSAPSVASPVAVRYGWADNPVCNLANAEGLPVTPFRSDGPGH